MKNKCEAPETGIFEASPKGSNEAYAYLQQQRLDEMKAVHDLRDRKCFEVQPDPVKKPVIVLKKADRTEKTILEE